MRSRGVGWPVTGFAVALPIPFPGSASPSPRTASPWNKRRSAWPRCEHVGGAGDVSARDPLVPRGSRTLRVRTRLAASRRSARACSSSPATQSASLRSRLASLPRCCARDMGAAKRGAALAQCDAPPGAAFVEVTRHDPRRKPPTRDDADEGYRNRRVEKSALRLRGAGFVPGLFTSRSRDTARVEV